MRVRTEGRLAGINRKLSVTLERLRIELGIDLSLWAELLGTTRREYVKALGTKQISLRSVEALANYFDMSMELLIDGNIDYAALAARLNGNLAILPERYAVGAFSSKRTVVNLLAYLEQTYGWPMVKASLRRLQVHEAAFKDPNGKLSIRFQNDLCDLLGAKGFGKQDFRRMGAYSPVTNRHSPIGQILGRARDSHELYTLMIEEAARLYDRNFDYAIAWMDGEACTVEARPSQLVQESLKTKTPGSIGACSTRAGVFESATSYIESAHAHVDEVRCIHRGDPFCSYRISFPQAARRISSV